MAKKKKTIKPPEPPDDDTPPWRTEAVVSLIRDMRDRQDFGNLPILADALEEGGYDDAPTLEVLRGDWDNYWTAEERDRTLCGFLGGEYQDAVEWIDAFVAGLDDTTPEYDDDVEEGEEPYNYATGFESSYSEFMETATRCLDGRPGEWGDYICLPYGTPDEYHGGSAEMRKFWDCYEVVTGRKVPDKDAGFIRCAC